MKLVICDLEAKDIEKLFPNTSEEIKITSNDGTIRNCIGCFGCWIKTPGACVIRDSYSDMGEYLSKCNEVIVISRCCYGGYSPFVKNVFDRSISYIHPYFAIRNGEMHHKRRYNNHIDMKVWFYGQETTDGEKETAQKLMRANAVNLDCTISKVVFIKDISELEALEA